MDLALVNLSIQAIILAIILLSTAFRMKGNFKLHAGVMTFGVAFGLVFGTIGAAMTFSESGYLNSIMSPTLSLATFVSHISVGLVTFASGVILVALLLMDKAIPGRSNLISKIVPVLWAVTFAVGFLFYLVLHVL